MKINQNAQNKRKIKHKPPIHQESNEVEDLWHDSSTGCKCLDWKKSNF